MKHVILISNIRRNYLVIDQHRGVVKGDETARWEQATYSQRRFLPVVV